MNILFFIGHDGFVRNFEGMLRCCIEREHRVHLALSSRRPMFMSEASSLEEFVDRSPLLTADRAPKSRDGDFASVEAELYGARDYLRYSAPRYRNASKLRERGRGYAPAWAQRLADNGLMRRHSLRAACDWTLRKTISSLPTSPQADAYVAASRADIALFTPLIGFGSTQNALLRSVRAAGIPSALLVHSWDNLSNKGLIHHVPDRVMVWNSVQADEAVKLHGVPRDQVMITGAHSFDHWFGRDPTPRATFMARLGLDPGRPLLLYACSSSFIAPDEPQFVRQWVDAVRASGRSGLAEANILVRPHPQQLEGWELTGLSEMSNVAVWPSPQDARAGSQARTDYFDSISHALGVVGVNTTAFVESAAVGTPTLTYLVDRYAGGQSGTLHFDHLRAGPLTVAPDFDRHLDDLERLLAGEDLDRGRSERFVRDFIRPCGLDRAPSELLMDAVERTATAPLAPARPSTSLELAVRQALRPWALRSSARADQERQLRKREAARHLPAER